MIFKKLSVEELNVIKKQITDNMNSIHPTRAVILKTKNLNIEVNEKDGKLIFDNNEYKLIMYENKESSRRNKIDTTRIGVFSPNHVYFFSNTKEKSSNDLKEIVNKSMMMINKEPFNKIWRNPLEKFTPREKHTTKNEISYVLNLLFENKKKKNKFYGMVKGIYELRKKLWMGVVTSGRRQDD